MRNDHRVARQLPIGGANVNSLPLSFASTARQCRPLSGRPKWRRLPPEPDETLPGPPSPPPPAATWPLTLDSAPIDTFLARHPTIRVHLPCIPPREHEYMPMAPPAT